MSNKSIYFGLKYKQLCILTHLLRDKSNKDKDELDLYYQFREELDHFKSYNHIPNKPYKP